MQNTFENPYLLLTPGPLSTSATVRAAMGRDWCTWDDDYNRDVVQVIRKTLVEISTAHTEEYTSVLMQGSGSFSVEAALGTAVGHCGQVLVLSNGAYGQRIAQICKQAKITYGLMDFGELAPLDPEALQAKLIAESNWTHVAFVHGETTTGMLNPLEALSRIVKEQGRTLIVDAMSTFGGIPIEVGELGIDFLISSANKCIQGVPGFGFVIARKQTLVSCKGNSPSLSLDLVAQWEEMDTTGKWRFTSPTHVVRAFLQALRELGEEGGIEARYKRYCENHRILVTGMESLGFSLLLPLELRSVMITSFLYPHDSAFQFKTFYMALKQKGFVIYPGKIGAHDTFRIGTIGDVWPHDFTRLVEAIQNVQAANYGAKLLDQSTSVSTN
jgi:2-aminoethylphosphonate-pyruvate transaminase